MTSSGAVQPQTRTHCCNSVGRTPLTGDGAQDSLSETNPGTPGRHGIRHGSFSRGLLSGRFNPRSGNDLVGEQFEDTPDVSGQSSSHGRCTGSSHMPGFAQLMMHKTEIVGASDQMHPRLKRSEATGSMAGFARPAGQPFPEGLGKDTARRELFSSYVSASSP